MVTHEQEYAIVTCGHFYSRGLERIWCVSVKYVSAETISSCSFKSYRGIYAGHAFNPEHLYYKNVLIDK